MQSNICREIFCRTILDLYGPALHRRYEIDILVKLVSTSAKENTNTLFQYSDLLPVLR
jgi:hypothetical protein